MSIKTQVLQHTLNSKQIDFFRLEKDYFNNTHNVDKHDVNLGSTEYLNRPVHLNDFKTDDIETVVFNFQVGKGKTTICYNLIKEYALKGCCVIVASPFVKLVRKDYEAISKLLQPSSNTGIVSGNPIVVGDYSDLKNGNYDKLPSICRVHVMTINCLLGNPGDNAIEQSFYKKEYLKNILELNKENQVVLFIDEIHESVHNFTPSLIPNLLRWNGVIKKVFIASATFTPATIPVIKAVSLLTSNNIRIFESERVKITPQAQLHLHVCDFPYSKNEYSFIQLIKKQVEDYRRKSKKVQILTGTKALAEKIAEECFGSTIESQVKVKSIQPIDTVNLLTGETDVLFQENQNNIGTTFKTGVNIVDKDGVLFIVFPTIKQDLKYRHYGIFNDGIPSIIQSLGRVRNGGDIHVFIHKPEFLLGDKAHYPSLFNHTTNQSSLPINTSFDEVTNKYQKEINSSANEIELMEKGLDIAQPMSPLSDRKSQFGMWYPNEHEYIMNKSQQIIMSTENTSYGRLISPYVLHAALHNQFINATLAEISYHYKDVSFIDLSSQNDVDKFYNLFHNKKATIKGQPFSKSIKNLSSLLGEHEEDGQKVPIKYRLKTEVTVEYSGAELINKQSKKVKQVYEALSKVYCDESYSFNEKQYLLDKIEKSSKLKESELTDFYKAYKELDEIKSDFLTWIETKKVVIDGKTYLQNNIYSDLPDHIAERVEKVAKLLRSEDILIRNKAVQFLQNLRNPLQEKRKIYNQLETLFLNKGNMIKKDKKRYYELKS